MDSGRFTINIGFRIIGLFAVVLVLIAWQGQTDPGDQLPPPDIIRWTQPGADPVAVLSVEPTECLRASALEQNSPEILLGRMAFRSPFLLGGQAVRQGLTCQACHTQGQTNAHFFILGLSDQPGTADVTNFHFSDALGDEAFNPSPIPSLSDDIKGVDYDPALADLETLVTRLITQEFSGPASDADVLAALLVYIRALDDEACNSPALHGDTLLQHKLDVISESFDVLSQDHYYPAARGFMIAGLRNEIGRLYRRYPDDIGIRRELEGLGQSLNARRAPVEMPALISAADHWREIRPKLAAAYRNSLFHHAHIKDWAESMSRR